MAMRDQKLGRLGRSDINYMHDGTSCECPSSLPMHEVAPFSSIGGLNVTNINFRFIRLGSIFANLNTYRSPMGRFKFQLELGPTLRPLLLLYNPASEAGV